VGAEPGDSASRVPAYRDGRGRGLVGGGCGGACVGERRRDLVRLALDHRPPDRSRRRGDRSRPSPLGEQRLDDVFLLRRRARGAPRVRPRGASRAAQVRAAPVRGDRGDGRRRRDLSRVQLRPPFRARLGDRHVDRHRLRARAARARRPALLGAPARIHAHGRRRGRPRRARHHRDGVHGDASRPTRSSLPSASTRPFSSRVASR
jgi:hypothetical protein